MRIICTNIVTGSYSKVLTLQSKKGKGLVLPGGKWEPGETFVECAKRELEEETGLKATGCELVFWGVNADGHFVYAFHTYTSNMTPLKETKEGKTCWSTWEELINNSSYKAFYELLYEAFQNRNAFTKLQEVVGV